MEGPACDDFCRVLILGVKREKAWVLQGTDSVEGLKRFVATSGYLVVLACVP